MPEPLHNTNYIAFADDIIQITSGPYIFADAARNTAHAIKQIAQIENKWKIRTNKNKLQIIPISLQKTTDIYIYDDILRDTTEIKILGLTFNSRGITPHIKIRTAIAQSNLMKLYRFYNQYNKRKLKLYNALVSSALIYPLVIKNTISKSPLLSMQRIQNKALRFITNTRWDYYIITPPADYYTHQCSNRQPRKSNVAAISNKPFTHPYGTS